MRLLTYDHNGRLTVTRDLVDNPPPYAILSHTWGADEEEVTYRELQNDSDQKKSGYRKIQFCGEQARRDGITHFWVDTCCIDKANHTELSEAITSMYRWYQQAQKCYVYLSDVSTHHPSSRGQHVWDASFRASRWFTRGWTLQELLAPNVVEFFSQEGDLLGTKQTLVLPVHEITSIPIAALQGTPLPQFAVTERMRWSQQRATKKKEDQAYCLLGIFNVFMPLIYGEGDYALRRLEKAVQEQHGVSIALSVGSSQTVRSLGLCLQSAPVIPAGDFVGRTHEIATVHHILRPDRGSTEQHRAILGGIGGIGKTQLALAYARQHQQSYSSVLWLNATSTSTLFTSLRTAAQALMSPDQYTKSDHERMLAHVHEWLCRSDNTRWLLIFDNHDEPEQYRLDTFCPSIGHGSVLVTTRLPELVTGETVRIQPLQDIDYSLTILQNRSGRRAVHQDIGARHLADRLNGLPLALVTAGAYLRRSTITFQQYLEVYEQRWQVDPRRPPRLQDYQDRTLYTTWNLSYTRLASEDPEAAQMLRLLAYFDHQELWYELFHAGRSDQLPEWLLTCLAGQMDFESVMGRLVDYCLVEVRSDHRSYSIHSCVHDWILWALNREIDAQLYWYAFDCVRASIKDDDWGSLGHIQYNQVGQHGVRLTFDPFAVCDEAEDGLSRRLDDALWIASMLQDQVQLSAAEQMYTRALARKERALGPDHTSTLNTVNNLGILYTDQGKLAEAEQMYTRALAGSEKALGPDHTSTLDTVNNLGILYTDQGKLAETEQMYTRALAGREKALGPDHTSTLNTVHNLGSLYADQGKLAEAEQMYTRALAGYEKALGPDHTSTLDSHQCLATLYCIQRKLDQAESTYQQLLVKYEAALGDDHPSTMMLVYNFGRLYEDQARQEEAKMMYRRALAGYEKRLGVEHPRTRGVADDLDRLCSPIR